MKNITQAVTAGPTTVGNIKKGGTMKILGYEVKAVKSSGVSETEIDGKKVTRNWSRIDLKSDDTVVLTLWAGKEQTDFEEGGKRTKYIVYRASKVDPKDKTNNLRKKWWIRVNPNSSSLVTTKSSAGNVYQEAIPTEVPAGWDVKAFYAPSVKKVGVSVTIKEVLI